jgi:hypothetical protein
MISQAPDQNGVMARPNLYLAIHKGLRAFMAHVLIEVGQVDVQDMEQSAAARDSLNQLLQSCHAHLIHENEFIHKAMEARSPGSASRLADEHEAHLQHIAVLAELAGSAETAPPELREAAWRRLYYQLSLFVAENYQHFLEEETRHMPVLWEHYDDGELMALEGSILASIPPDEMALNLRWILPSLSHGERLQILGGQRGQVSAEEFSRKLSMIRPLLAERDWTKLHRAFER